MRPHEKQHAIDNDINSKEKKKKNKIKKGKRKEKKLMKGTVESSTIFSAV